MREQLLVERAILRQKIGMCMMGFMRETDKEEARKLLIVIEDLCSKVERINCKLAQDELRTLLNNTDS